MAPMTPDRSEWSDAQQHLWELQDRIYAKLDIIDAKQSALVLALDLRLTTVLKTVDDRLYKMNADVAAVKVRSSIWGGISGGLTALIGVTVDYLRKHA